MSLLGHLPAPSSLHLPEPLGCHQSQALLLDQDVSTNGRGRRYPAGTLRNQGWEPKQTDKGKNLSQKKSSYSSSWERPLNVT